MNIEFGRMAEEAAAGFLRSRGYKIIRRNYRARSGEIDIIASEGDAICFVEVKARHSNLFGSPEEAVSYSKQRQIAKAALSYLRQAGLPDKPARFDVVSLLYSGKEPEIELIKGAFELDPKLNF
jgi:putative endonuclease